jgi:hypothetical protein
MPGIDGFEAALAHPRAERHLHHHDHRPGRRGRRRRRARLRRRRLHREAVPPARAAPASTRLRRPRHRRRHAAGGRAPPGSRRTVLPRSASGRAAHARLRDAAGSRRRLRVSAAGPGWPAPAEAQPAGWPAAAPTDPPSFDGVQPSAAPAQPQEHGPASARRSVRGSAAPPAAPAQPIVVPSSVGPQSPGSALATAGAGGWSPTPGPAGSRTAISP